MCTRQALLRVGFLLGLSLLSFWIIETWVAAEFNRARQIRVTLDVEEAIKTGKTRDGELNIIKETRSAKYHFLNKRVFEVHSSEQSRRGTELKGELAEDQARALRHVDAVRTQRPQVRSFSGGGFLVTLAKGLRSAEVRANPPKNPNHLSMGFFFGLPFLLGLIGFALASRWTHAGLWPLIALALGIAAVYLGDDFCQAANTAADALLREDGRRAPKILFSRGFLMLSLAGIHIAGALVLGIVASARFGRLLTAFQRDRHAYLAISPAMLGLFGLIGIPFVVGMGLAFFRHVHGDFSFVGLQNFYDILSGQGGPHSVFYTLLVTILWTSVNVVLHLGFGLALALLLHRYASKWTRIYRVILIIPWAVPSYLTALIWRSMFDADIGVINRVLGLTGMSWMHNTFTAFIANLVTNVWLGVPFMMVVCLGALTSIPRDLYDAAEVDGASAWQGLTNITLPLLRPALLPAVILGAIWTFNKFEVIYLVSEGRPDGATDILVTEAYRWAFERGLAQGGAYGKAAACSVLIFVVLLLYAWMTARVSRSAEEALR